MGHELKKGASPGEEESNGSMAARFEGDLVDLEFTYLTSGSGSGSGSGDSLGSTLPAAPFSLVQGRTGSEMERERAERATTGCNGCAGCWSGEGRCFAREFYSYV